MLDVSIQSTNQPNNQKMAFARVIEISRIGLPNRQNKCNKKATNLKNVEALWVGMCLQNSN